MGAEVRLGWGLHQNLVGVGSGMLQVLCLQECGTLALFPAALILD